VFLQISPSLIVSEFFFWIGALASRFLRVLQLGPAVLMISGDVYCNI